MKIGSVAKCMAAAAVSAFFGSAIPASANESAGRAKTVKSVPGKIHRLQAVRHDHAALGCSGVWCGRQFVLMLGVAY